MDCLAWIGRLLVLRLVGLSALQFLYYLWEVGFRSYRLGGRHFLVDAQYYAGCAVDW